MVTRMIKSTAVAFTASVLLMSSSVQATTISIAAPPSLADVLSELTAAFQTYYIINGNLNYQAALTVDTTENIKNDIIAGTTSGPYDLLLTPDYTVLDLAYKYPSLVVGGPFQFGSDVVSLFSASVDIGAGLPTQLTQDFVIADPTKDIYGFAAAQVLLTTPGALVAYNRGHIKTRVNIGTTYATIGNGEFPYGFVAKSQICRNYSGTEFYPEGTYHHNYPSTGSGHPYLPIKLKGIKIAKTRATDQDAELAAFIDFLTGQGTTVGTETLKQYCYTTP